MSFTTTFEGKLIEALCLDITDEGKNVMLLPEIRDTFDKEGSNSWKDSSIRMELNSDVFMYKLDKDFINHTVVKKIHTCDYTTYDRFWLLSHEEVGFNTDFFKENYLCKKFQYFDGTYKSRCFDEILCSPCSWWLRSADSGISSIVGYVNGDGGVYGDGASYYNAVLPVCLIR